MVVLYNIYFTFLLLGVKILVYILNNRNWLCEEYSDDSHSSLKPLLFINSKWFRYSDLYFILLSVTPKQISPTQTIQMDRCRPIIYILLSAFSIFTRITDYAIWRPSENSHRYLLYDRRRIVVFIPLLPVPCTTNLKTTRTYCLSPFVPKVTFQSSLSRRVALKSLLSSYFIKSWI